MMPHLAETCWEALGKTGLVADAPWPEVDPALLVDDTVTIAVQVNGKRRGEITVAKGAPADEVETAGLVSGGGCPHAGRQGAQEDRHRARQDRQCRRLSRLQDWVYRAGARRPRRRWRACTGLRPVYGGRLAAAAGAEPGLCQAHQPARADHLPGPGAAARRVRRCRTLPWSPSAVAASRAELALSQTTDPCQASGRWPSTAT